MATLTPMGPSILAFDTSTETMSLGLCWPGGTRTVSSEGGARASANLLPQVRALMRQAGLAFGDLDAVAFGRGPGAFTGLRTACAAAQGLALGAGLPVLPLDSLAIVAECARARLGPAREDRGSAPFEVGVVMDARMGEVYAGAYAWAGAGWQVLVPPRLCDPASVRALWPRPPSALAGHGLSLAGLDADGVASDGGSDRAMSLLALAGDAWREGRAVDPALALPVYIRDRVAATTAERETAAQRQERAA